MNEEQTLPTGWIQTKLGAIAEIIGGGTPSREEAKFFGGDIVWVTPTEVPKETVSVINDSREKITTVGFHNSSVRMIPLGSVLLTSRASIGYVAISGVPLTTNQGFASFVLTEDIVPKYLGWWLKGKKEYLEEQAKGTTFKEISKSELREIIFPLAPLAEQQRIVAAIEQQFTRLDAGVAALRQAQAKLKRYRAAVLKAAVEGKLTEQWRTEYPATETGADLLQRILAERRAKWEADQRAKGKDPAKVKYQEPAALDTADLPDLPEGWVWATVEQLSSFDLPNAIQSGPFGSDLLHSEFQKEGVLAIGIDNVLEGRFSIGKEHRISYEKYEQLKKFQARPLDVLITVMATIGRCCVTPEDIEASIITKHVYRITPNQSIINPKYLVICLWGGNEVRRQLYDGVHGQTRPGLNGEIIKQISIPMPTLSEQEEIIDATERCLSIVAEVESEIVTNLKRAERLRQSILREAFAGRLVKQDPADEPASVLLKRIRQERAEREGDGQKARGSGRKQRQPEPEADATREAALQLTLIANDEE